MRLCVSATTLAIAFLSTPCQAKSLTDDILEDGLWSSVPYYKGALFFKALEEEVGRPAVIAALSSFYMEKRGTATGTLELLEHLDGQTGFDSKALQTTWLTSTGLPPFP